MLGVHVKNLINPRAEWRHRSIVFTFNSEHISHLVLVLLLLILSMYLIARFDIVYLLLERISTNWNAHHIASSSKQDIFIINFNAKCNVNFFYLFYLLINEINSYLLTCSISTTCKNSNSSPWPNSFLNIHIWKFKRSNISGTEYKPTKNPLWKIKVLGLPFKILHYVALVSDIDANSFAHFRFGALNSEKDKYLKKRKNTFWNK